MKQQIITIAALVLVGCGESQQTSPQPETGSQTAPINSIHDAAKRGDIEAVKQYLADNANVNSKDSKGMTPFAKDNTIGRTPLHIAAGAGHKKIVELLIAKGADVNAMDIIEWSPLHYATIWKHKEIVELLIANGADVNAKDMHDETPLDGAINDKLTEITALLRKHGAKTGKELRAAGN